MDASSNEIEILTHCGTRATHHFAELFITYPIKKRRCRWSVNRDPSAHFLPDMGSDSRSIELDHKVHFVGGSKAPNLNHYIWDRKNGGKMTFGKALNFGITADERDDQFTIRSHGIFTSLQPSRRLIVAGGHHNGKCSDKIIYFSLDSANAKWIVARQKLPFAMCDFGFVTIPKTDCALIVGGNIANCDDRRLSNAIYLVDLRKINNQNPTRQCWVKCRQTLPKGLSYIGCCLGSNRELHVLGGFDGTAVQSKHYIYDVSQLLPPQYQSLLASRVSPIQSQLKPKRVAHPKLDSKPHSSQHCSKPKPKPNTNDKNSNHIFNANIQSGFHKTHLYKDTIQTRVDAEEEDEVEEEQGVQEIAEDSSDMDEEEWKVMRELERSKKSQKRTFPVAPPPKRVYPRLIANPVPLLLKSAVDIATAVNLDVKHGKKQSEPSVDDSEVTRFVESESKRIREAQSQMGFIVLSGNNQCKCPDCRLLSIPMDITHVMVTCTQRCTLRYHDSNTGPDSILQCFSKTFNIYKQTKLKKREKSFRYTHSLPCFSPQCKGKLNSACILHQCKVLHWFLHPLPQYPLHMFADAVEFRTTKPKLTTKKSIQKRRQQSYPSQATSPINDDCIPDLVYSTPPPSVPSPDRDATDEDEEKRDILDIDTTPGYRTHIDIDMPISPINEKAAVYIDDSRDVNPTSEQRTPRKRKKKKRGRRKKKNKNNVESVPSLMQSPVQTPVQSEIVDKRSSDMDGTVNCTAENTPHPPNDELETPHLPPSKSKCETPKGCDSSITPPHSSSASISNSPSRVNVTDTVTDVNSCAPVISSAMVSTVSPSLPPSLPPSPSTAKINKTLKMRYLKSIGDGYVLFNHLPCEPTMKHRTAAMDDMYSNHYLCLLFPKSRLMDPVFEACINELKTDKDWQFGRFAEIRELKYFADERRTMPIKGKCIQLNMRDSAMTAVKGCIQKIINEKLRSATDERSRPFLKKRSLQFVPQWFGGVYLEMAFSKFRDNRGRPNNANRFADGPYYCRNRCPHNTNVNHRSQNDSTVYCESLSSAASVVTELDEGRQRISIDTDRNIETEIEGCESLPDLSVGDVCEYLGSIAVIKTIPNMSNIEILLASDETISVCRETLTLRFSHKSGGSIATNQFDNTVLNGLTDAQSNLIIESS